MSTFPTDPLLKDDLRSLLSSLLQGSPGLLSLSSSNRVERWAIVANLINEKGLTPEGTIVATRDPYLETVVTDWFIHFHLSVSDWSMWRYFIYEFLPNHQSFTQNALLEELILTFAEESSNQLKKSVRLLLRTYLDPQSIAKNSFLKREHKLYSAGISNLSNPYTLGYLLAKLWKRDFGLQSSVLVDQILFAEMGLASVLGIHRKQLRQYLDILENHGIIEQRSATPHLVGTKPKRKEGGEQTYQVYRCWETAIELLESAYDHDVATPNRPLIQSLEPLLSGDDDTPDFSKLLEWVSGLVGLDGGSNTMISLAS
ncbi:DUF4007 family protein [Leptolyngbya ohadii]|uniref:DUF4007 family protein n=1 Tax=Leptolyngbya ohadii TaxID=1962290 RepID=UPI000B59BE2E|nr:DUF4007 family protein [Leptolyngbya ohadii]